MWRSQIALILICSMAATSASAAERATVDFSTQIQPLLAEKCIHCHGVDENEGGLRLYRRDLALDVTDAGHRAIVPGRPEASVLLERVRATGDERMPPEGDPLTPEQVELLTRWIKQGASWQIHWSYRPLDESGRADDFALAPWVTNRIDVYVLQELVRRGITPSKRASPSVLVKRLYYDLLGLPPKPEDVDRFVQDPSPGAYEALVDSLLASPHFGERWGRHWLDKARYADSDGYEKDKPRPDAWRYRDWVISSINHDMSFRRFTAEQIAGDLLPEATPDQYLATAFHRQTLTNTEGGTNPEQWRVAAVMDRTETLGTVWLGLTVGCARCHTHKYDQLTQREYYQLYAFFDNADEVRHDVFKTPTQRRLARRERRMFDRQVQVLEQRVKELEASLGTDQQEWEAMVERTALSTELQQILQVSPERRDESARAKLKQAHATAAKPLTELRNALKDLNEQGPAAETMSVRVVRQRTKQPRTTRILRRGDFRQPEEAVVTGTLETLPPIVPRAAEADRLDLAHWLVQAGNPLVARVVVNHVWQHLFGEGLVTTPNDFGVRGEPPAHPRLLDHLALEYARTEWSRKALVRYIVMSSTYRQSSVYRPEATRVDPRNRWLHRQNRFRVEAEVLRDLTLSVSGLLSRRIGGASVFPPMPAGVAAISYANNFKWSTSPGEDRYRRGMYTFFKRTAPHPTLMTFDCPDANVTNVRRDRSNTPLGALTLLNNPVYYEAARELARQLLDIAVSDRERIREAMRRCVARRAKDAETEALETLLDESRIYFQHHPDDARRLVSSDELSASSASELAAWTAVVRVMLNLDEFICRE